jgi:replicative DNA helicase
MSDLMPNEVDLEKKVLGAILLDSEAINSVTGIITNDNLFYNNRNRMVWSAIKSLHYDENPIDVETVFNKLKSLHPKQAKDLAIYVAELTNQIGSSANIETHALILKEMYVSRRVAEIAERARVDALDESKDPFDVYDKVLTEFDSLNNEINRSQYVTFAEIIGDSITQMREAAKSGEYKTGLKTFLDELDRVTLGFQQTDLVIVAARPSMGKTALVVDIARKQARNIHAPVAIFSLEMSAAQLAQRMLSAETKIPLESIRKGGLKSNEWLTLDSAEPMVKGLPIYICDKGGLSINEICSIAKNWKVKHGIQAIYVDYIQLISNQDKSNRNGNREQEISSISRRLKQLAKELHVPVIALSQLSRKCEERTDKRPMLSDLRESGAIEQDADMVVFLYRDEYYNDSAQKGLTELIIAKHRNGKTGMVETYFNGECQTFLNQASY